MSTRSSLTGWRNIFSFRLRRSHASVIKTGEQIPSEFIQECILLSSARLRFFRGYIFRSITLNGISQGPYFLNVDITRSCFHSFLRSYLLSTSQKITYQSRSVLTLMFFFLIFPVWRWYSNCRWHHLLCSWRYFPKGRKYIGLQNIKRVL